MKDGEGDMDQSRIEQMEKLGFEWTLRHSKKKQNS